MESPLGPVVVITSAVLLGLIGLWIFRNAGRR